MAGGNGILVAQSVEHMTVNHGLSVQVRSKSIKDFFVSSIIWLMRMFAKLMITVRVCSHTVFTTKYSVAQLDRVLIFDVKGYWFEPNRIYLLLFVYLIYKIEEFLKALIFISKKVFLYL